MHLEKNWRQWLFWLCCGGLTFFPACVLGGSYAPVLDDYIMYRGYHLYDISYLLGTVRVWTTRPVANFLDVFLWSHFHSHLFLLLLIMTLLRLAGVWLVSRFFENQGWEGAVMPLCLLLLWCPLGVEATAWLAASTRISVGLFLMGCALAGITRRHYVCGGLFLLLSYGCYEQVALVGCCLATWALWQDRRRLFWLPGALGGVLGVFYLVCSRWNTTPRDAISTTPAGTVVKAIGHSWQAGLGKLVPNSIVRGGAVLAERPWLWILLLGFAAAMALLWQPKKSRRHSRWMGAGIFCICFLPFFLLQDNGMSFRVLYLPMLGLALLVQGGTGAWRRVVAGALAIGFCVGCAGEYRDYQRAGQEDERHLIQLAEQLEDGELSVSGPVFYPSSVNYGQHILSVTHSDWSLTAGLRATTGNTELQIKK